MSQALFLHGRTLDLKELAKDRDHLISLLKAYEAENCQCGVCTWKRVELRDLILCHPYDNVDEVML